MIIPTDSESDDADEKSDLQFAPNLSNRSSSNEKAKRKAKLNRKERAKKMMDSVLAISNQWKCGTCSRFFRTSVELRQHIVANHKDQKHFCNRCPYSSKSLFNVKKHQQVHFTNDGKFKTEGRECKLCKIEFATNGHFFYHLRQYHLPNDSQ